jgi:hypothetical protein
MSMTENEHRPRASDNNEVVDIDAFERQATDISGLLLILT